MFSIENSIIEWIINTFEALGYPGIFFFMVIEPTVLPFPGEIILTLAGWILVSNYYELFFVSLLATIGTLIGCTCEYFIARTFGIKLINKFGKYFFITEKDIKKTESYFLKYGYMFVFITRFIPLFPKPLTSIVAGIYKMNIYKYSIITFIASFPSNLLYIYVGNRLGKNYGNIAEYIDPFKLPLLIAGFALVLFYFAFKFYKMKRSI